jgi:hypothetical protein
MLPRPALPRPWALLAVALVAAVAVAAQFRVHPDGLFVGGHELPSVCVHEALGHGCPGCGTTRSGILLLQGDLLGSLRMQPALPLFLAAALLAFRAGARWRFTLARVLALLGLGLAALNLLHPLA